MKPSLIGLIEAAYDLDRDDDAWCRSMASGLGAYCGGDDMTLLLEFDATRPPEQCFSRVITPAMGAATERALLAAFQRRGLVTALDEQFGPPDLFPPLARLSTMLGGSPLDSPIFEPFARFFGFSEIIALGVNDGTGRGLIINLPTAAKRRGLEAARQAQRALPHLSAALRLRRALGPGGAAEPGPGGAVLGVDGALREGDLPASARERLRAAVVARDRARTRQGERSPSALDGWTALVEGRWSLVDVFERGGQRFVVAHPNLPDVVDPRHLSPLERAVFSGLTRGLSNKALCYELGLAEGTIAGYVRSLRGKLGEAARAAPLAGAARAVDLGLPAVELVALVCDAPGREAFSGLSSAERAVILEVIAGRSNAAVAARRQVSARTVANQLASAYRKLGVSSRRDLLARLGQPPQK